MLLVLSGTDTGLHSYTDPGSSHPPGPSLLALESLLWLPALPAGQLPLGSPHPPCSACLLLPWAPGLPSGGGWSVSLPPVSDGWLLSQSRLPPLAHCPLF